MAADAPAPPDLDEAAVQAKLAGTDRPYVTLKAACTLDGRIATRTGESKWITGEPARVHGHRLRARHEGILVGSGTVLADNPALTVRLPEAWAAEALAGPPARIVLDSTAATPVDAAWLTADGATRILVVGCNAPAERIAAFEAAGARVLRVETARPEPAALLPALRRLGVTRLLVEGGGRVHGALIASGEADALFLFMAGSLVGDPSAPSWNGGPGVAQLAQAPRLLLHEPQRIGADVLIRATFRGSAT